MQHHLSTSKRLLSRQAVSFLCTSPLDFIIMKQLRCFNHYLPLRTPGSVTPTRRVWYSNQPRPDPTVQTPLQSQNKDDLAHPGIQPAEGARVQTPVQAQNPTQLAPNTARPSRSPPSNAAPLATFWALAFATPFVCYFYYQYRKEHMDQKKAMLLREAQERYKNSG